MSKAWAQGGRQSLRRSKPGLRAALTVAVAVLAGVAPACSGQPQAGPAAVVGDPAASSLAARGKAIAEKHGCLACHSTDGTILFGPSWKGLYGSQLRFTDGTTAVADEDYLRDSINNPTAKIIDGWYIAMPGQIPTSEEEVTALVAYLKTLR